MAWGRQKTCSAICSGGPPGHRAAPGLRLHAKAGLYSVLPLLQVLSGLVVMLYLYKLYGTAQEAALYLQAVSTVGVFQLLLLLFAEQFIFYLHQLSPRRERRVRLFYGSYLALACLISLLFCLLCHRASPWIAALAAAGLPAAERQQLAHYLNLFLPYVFAFLPSQVVQQYWQFRGSIAKSYLLGMAPGLVMALLFVYAAYRPLTMDSMIWLYACSSCLALALAVRLTRPRLVLSAAIWRRYVQPCLWRSVKMRAAHNVHNVALLLIVNNFAAALPVAERAVFFYAKKAADTFLSVVYGPVHKLMTNRVSCALQEKQAGSLLQDFRRNDVLMAALFAAGIVLAYLSLPLLDYVKPLALAQQHYLWQLFALLSLQNLLMAMELPAALVSAASHQHRVFWRANLLFLLLLLAVSWPLSWLIPRFCVPIAAIVAQLANFFMIRRHAAQYLQAPLQTVPRP